MYRAINRAAFDRACYSRNTAAAATATVTAAAGAAAAMALRASAGLKRAGRYDRINQIGLEKASLFAERRALGGGG